MKQTFQNKTVLITGHTGFKGSWLTLWMQSLGANVIGFSKDIPTETSHFNHINNNDLIDLRHDISDPIKIKEVIDKYKPDFIFHLAAQALVRDSYIDPVCTWNTNTFGTLNLLEALRLYKNKCICIFITSDKCYDNVEWIWGYKETDALGGPDPYSASKGGAELVLKSYIKSFFNKEGNIRIGIARAGNVIGGGDWANDRIIPDCVKSWSKNQPVELRNPNSTRPWQHVLEPLSGYIALAIELFKSNKLHGEAFNFGPPSFQNNTVYELVNEMSKYWDQVKWNDISNSYNGPYESSLLKLNCDKALFYLKWKSVWDFKETVKKTSLWYKEYYQGDTNLIKKFSEQQILEYTDNAKKLDIKWAI